MLHVIRTRVIDNILLREFRGTAKPLKESDRIGSLPVENSRVDSLLVKTTLSFTFLCRTF